MSSVIRSFKFDSTSCAYITLGVSVQRRSLPAGSFVDSSDAEKGSKHACVKSSG